MRNLLTLLFLIAATTLLTAQSAKKPKLADNGLSYSLNSVMVPLSISQNTLEQANTIMDINGNFNPEWVKEYISVEVVTSQKGQSKITTSRSATLTAEQKTQFLLSDVATEIGISINYIPNNNLSKNDPKEMNFSFLVNPEIKAAFPGGQKVMNEFLKKNAVDKISDTDKIGNHIGIVKFTVSKNGVINNVHVFEASRDEKIDQILLETVSSMPNWSPASYADGTKVDQDFVFMVGNLESCSVNLANVSRE